MLVFMTFCLVFDRRKGAVFLQRLQKLPIKIVYVEDNEEIRHLTAEYLENHVASLYTAGNGEEGLALLQEVEPDVVITDMEMPVMNGLDMIKKIREERPDIPIFVTTTYEDTLYLTEAIKYGITHYIYKQSDPARLLDSIRDFFKLIHNSFLTMELTEEGDILSVSDTFAHFLGFSKEELLHKPVDSLLVPLNDVKQTSFLSRLQTFEQVENLQAVFRKRSGAEVLLSGAGKLISENENDQNIYETHWYPIECLLRSHREITERLQKECYLKSLMQLHAYISQEAMRSSDIETFLQDILDRLPTIDPDLSGCLLSQSNALALRNGTRTADIDFDRLFPVPIDLENSEHEKIYLPCFLAAIYDKMIFIDDIGHLADSPFKSALTEYGIVTLVSIPLDQTSLASKSVLTLMFGHHQKFDKEELDLWQNIANTMGFGIESINLRLERDALIRKLDTMAHTDNLTGIINRYRGVELLESEIVRAKRYEKIFSIIFFDIDNFKKINDTYGHHMGDKVLIKVAESIDGALRSTDALIRWGGEEFLILLPETSLHDAVHLAQKLRKRIEQRDSGIPIPVTASFGVTEWDRDQSLDILISRADSKMYEAKREGRNRIAY